MSAANSQTPTPAPLAARPGSARKCSDCGCRVPQYDKELELARLEVNDWKDVAARLYAAMGLGRRERRRVHAENAYHKLMYRRPNCRPCPECGQPVLPDGQMRPHPDWYRHASGCSRDDWSPNATGSATGAERKETQP